jgi:hypothetical protein
MDAIMTIMWDLLCNVQMWQLCDRGWGFWRRGSFDDVMLRWQYLLKFYKFKKPQQMFSQTTTPSTPPPHKMLNIGTEDSFQNKGLEKLLITLLITQEKVNKN